VVQVGSAAAPAHPSPSAERRLVSVLFADLVGFTAQSESRDPEEVRELLTRYFDICRELIGRYGGVVEKFIGDAVMAVWGTPVANEDDAERAVRAALELTATVSALGQEVGAKDLMARAGVLTGEAAVTLGAEGQGMVAGDLVNTASRVQSVAPPGAVYVGDSTRRLSEAAIVYEDVGAHELKGKAEPVPLWRAVRVVGGIRGAARSTGLEPPFVGRDRELRLIKELFHGSADERNAHLVSVMGVGGIGKSRLMWEFSKYVDGLVADTRWHHGRSLAYGEGVAFWALAEMVRTNAEIVEGEEAGSALEKLRRAVEHAISDPEERRFVQPRLAHLLGLEDREHEDQQNLFSAWRLFYERLADEMPTVMVFEDLHWADSALLDFIEYLIDWSRDHPIFILTLARPELADRRPSWGAGKRNFTSIFLEPLPTDAMEVLLTGPVPGLPDELRARILERAEGVPFYAVETVRMLMDRGLIAREGNTYRATGPIETLDVPETLHALIAARLDGLASEERQLLQDASVLGRTFTVQGLVAMTALTEADLQPLLTSLVRKEVLSLTADPLSPERGQYGFLQDLVKKVAYDTLSKKERRIRHLSAAAHLESTAEEDEVVEVVASHYLDAFRSAPDAPDADEIRARAREMMARAAERAGSLGANAEAQRRFEQAAELVDSEPERAELLERAGEMASKGRRYDDAKSHLASAMAILDGAGQAHASARVSAKVAEIDWVEGRLDQAVERMEDLFRSLSNEEPDRDLAVLAVQLGRVLYLRGEPQRAEEPNEVALAIGEALALPDIISQALNTKAILAATRGRHEECLALLGHALQIAVENDLPDAALRAFNNLAETMTDRDRHEEALVVYERGLALGRRVGDELWLRSLLSEVVFPLLMLGRWDDAQERADEIPDSKEPQSDIIGLLVSMPVIHLARGDVEAARRVLGLFEGYRQSSDVQEAAALSCARASLLRAEGRPKEALTAAREAILGGLQIGTPATVKIGYTQAMAAAFSMGDLDEVERLVAEIDGMKPGVNTPFLRALADRWRARATATRGSDERVEASFKAAAGLFRETGIPYWRALTQLEHGEWLIGQDRAGEAKPLLGEAREVFERLHAQPWLDRLDRLDGVEAVEAVDGVESVEPAAR
jgi:class 3 adenylate cyclase/tetratricopeptide (TPR) repeat protein